jgi:site-specific recombinase XerC
MAITAVQLLHVAAWMDLQTKTLAAPTVKQRLEAIRHLFDWLVTGQDVPHNPGASVLGPSHIARKGKTRCLMNVAGVTSMNTTYRGSGFGKP